MSYSRIDFYRGAGDSRGWSVFLMTMPSAATLLVIGSRTPRHFSFSVPIALVAFLAILLSGYRSSAMFPLLIGIILWSKTRTKIPSWLAVGTITFVLFAIPAVSLLRASGAYEDINREAVSSSFKEAKLERTFTEMGSTAGVLANILRLVPSIDKHRWGMSYVQALRKAVPNIGLKQGESTRAGIKNSLLRNQETVADLLPSDWITYRIARDKFDRGEGVGFSAIGEPYLNFGVGGVIAFFLLLGWLLGRLDSTNLLLHPKLMIFSGAMLWPLIRTVRNDAGNFIKPLVFMALILLIWKVGSKLLPLFEPKKIHVDSEPPAGGSTNNH